MIDKYKRSTPEEALKKIQSEAKGHLKIFLGYAPGVGKTYSMLREGNRRLSRGQNIAIGLIEKDNYPETLEQIKNLKIIAPKKIIYNDREYEEVDVETIILKKPSTIIIDNLCHLNFIGSKNKYRYEDIEEILQHGINVITTLNIAHMESLNIAIRKITGVKITEVLKDCIVENAAEVVLVDVSPDELIKRYNNNDILQRKCITLGIKNFFTKNNLCSLREFSLRLTAEGVDEDLAQYMRQHDIHESWHTVERVMVCISANSSSKKLIRKGAKISGKYKCEWYVVNVDCTHLFAPRLTAKNRELLSSNLRLAKELGAEVINLKGKSISRTLSTFATEKYITQIIIGSSRRTKLQSFLRGSTVTKLIKFTKNIEFHVVPSG